MKKKTYNQVYYAKNRKREIARVKKYSQENPERIKKSRKNWYQNFGVEYRKNNLDKIRKAGREWARRNKKPYFLNENKRI